MKFKIILTLILLMSGKISNSQGISNMWLLGYSSSAGPPFGGTNLDFTGGIPSIYYVNRPMSFKMTSANIADSLGNVLFSTNGYYIADASGDTMLNGSGINPSNFTSQFPEGLTIPQANLILPKPGDSNLYYLFHSTIDIQSPSGVASYLYYSIIDVTQNGGLGAVILKNQIIISDSLNQGKISACKHANGRDWWILCNRVNSNRFYQLLLTPSGVSGPLYQDIGIVWSPTAGQSCFSPDGSKYAYSWPYIGLEIFDFDRCTGILSNPIHLTFEDTLVPGGVAFSSNSKMIYQTLAHSVLQYDVSSTNIDSTEYLVAEWDSFYSPAPPFATLFLFAQLAPNGKIYISTGNSTSHLHVINSPDSSGIFCDMHQHGVVLPTKNFNTLPNHPNYFLGPVFGSVCDSLTSDEISMHDVNISVQPNPSYNTFTLTYPPDKDHGKLEILNDLGEIILTEHIAPWSQFKSVDLLNYPPGIYFCRINWKDKKVSKKIIKI